LTPAAGNVAIPAGYHNGSGYVQGVTARMYAEGYATADAAGNIQVTGISFNPLIVSFTFFYSNNQSTYLYFSTDSGQWTYCLYTGTNPSGAVAGYGITTSPYAWGSGGFSVSTIGGVWINWRAWR
jgi:hypothetical protein